MRLHLDRRSDRFGAIIGFVLRLIWDAVAIAIRPASVAAVRAKIIDLFGRQIVTQPVAAVVGSPDSVRFRIECEPNCIPQAGGKGALAASVIVVLSHGCAALVIFYAHVAT